MVTASILVLASFGNLARPIVLPEYLSTNSEGQGFHIWTCGKMNKYYVRNCKLDFTFTGWNFSFHFVEHLIITSVSKRNRMFVYVVHIFDAKCNRELHISPVILEVLFFIPGCVRTIKWNIIVHPYVSLWIIYLSVFAIIYFCQCLLLFDICFNCLITCQHLLLFVFVSICYYLIYVLIASSHVSFAIICFCRYFL